MIKMKNKQERHYILVVLLLAVLAVLILPNLIISSVKNVTKDTLKQLGSNGKYTIEIIDRVSGTGVHHSEIEVLNAKKIHTTMYSVDVDIADVPGSIFYCSELGTYFEPLAAHATEYPALRIQYAVRKYTNNWNKKKWPRYCDGKGGHREFTDLGKNTYPLFKCGSHVDVLQAGGNYDPAAGYILTYPDIEEVTDEKQQALWNTSLNEGIKAEPNEIYEEAVHYQEFHDKITDGGTNLEKPDIKAKDETDKDKVRVKANVSEQTLTVGPYSIDYINGIFKDPNITFGGISNMYMKGYNASGEEVKSKIDIKAYIDQNNKTYDDLKYFKPNRQEKSFVDRAEEQVYPKGKSGGEDSFNVVIDNPNEGVDDPQNYVAYVELHIEFQWMAATKATICRMDGYYYTVNWDCKHNVRHNNHADCMAESWLDETETQKHDNLLNGERILCKAELVVGEKVKVPMKLGGYVWEDVPSGKESIADGKLAQNDRMLPNIKVTLYKEDGQIAQLMDNPSEGGLSDAEVIGRVNPTYTNEAGYYLFDGLDPLTKYYVQFEYNGQTYLPTDYKQQNASWEESSKGTETPNERDEYDNTYAEIGSSPANYKVPNGALNIAPLVNGYNEAFSQYELMGFEMTENGDYKQGIRLIDSFFKIENGNIVETDTLQEGEISKQIKSFILSNYRSPSDSDMVSIYRQIAGNDQKMLRKLQFISDTKIHSYTQAQGAGKDEYPMYDAFLINNGEEISLDMGGGITLYYDNSSYNGYTPIYPEQFYINQGLWRRPEVDLALRKDILYAATRINGKTEVYGYNKRNEFTEDQKAELRRLRQIYEQNGRKPADYTAYLTKKAEFEQANMQNGQGGYWEIQLRMRDYNNYYSGNYTRELYTADYNYRSDSTNKAGADKELQLYVTYKITIRNTSQSILNEVTEVVDYYDKDYTYRDDLSWVMYKQNSNSNNLEEINFTESDYYDSMKALSLQGNISKNNKGTKSAPTGQYEARSSECKSDMAEDYNEIYINGLAGKKLASGEEAYIYLTFQVKSDSKGPVILDDNNSLKQNYSEINGYKTYYKDSTQLPNGVTKGSNDVAGLIDINSTPGNLCKDDLKGNKYEKNFENDTDRAKSIKVTIDDNYIRSINGTVWEDERTKIVSNAVIGDGIRQDKEVGITGATVELVERLEDGSEYVWRTTTTQNGKYEFKTDESNKNYIIPGNYFIRFTYGHNKAIVNTTDNGGANKTSYNGQDFKSTVYQKNMNTNKELSEYTGMKIEKYDGKYAGNDVGYYDIKQADNMATSGIQLSDAKDLWTRREEIIKYSNEKVTNSKAEILASPYTTGNTEALIKNTNMTAVTGLIVLEGEYNRTDTDGSTANSNGSKEYLYGNDYNGKYTLNNVDLGLTERPKAQLELGKKITNVKITLANGNILFDANKAMTDLTWTLKAQEYKLNSVGIKNNKYQEFYGANNHRYTYRTEKGTAKYSVNGLVSSIYANQGNNGLIVATMDEELMQGANIRITYDMTVTNVGETDYEGQDFYYKGTGATKVVTTKADVVADYVANNLSFKAENNNGTGWQVVSNSLTALGLNNTLAENVAKYNNVIKTEKLGVSLKPSEYIKVGLVLTQLVNPENSSDDRTYDNIAEITTISNTAGRRMAYSIQGNQDPTKTPEEVDSVKSERVTILPPFGIGNTVVYIAIAAVVLVILAGGIILIKKKVLTK